MWSTSKFLYKRRLHKSRSNTTAFDPYSGVTWFPPPSSTLTHITCLETYCFLFDSLRGQSTQCLFSFFFSAKNELVHQTTNYNDIRPSPVGNTLFIYSGKELSPHQLLQHALAQHFTPYFILQKLLFSCDPLLICEPVCNLEHLSPSTPSNRHNILKKMFAN